MKNDHILLKNVLLKLNLQDEGHLYAKCLFYILSFCYRSLLFQFFSRGIRMYIAVLAAAQRGQIMG